MIDIYLTEQAAIAFGSALAGALVGAIAGGLIAAGSAYWLQRRERRHAEKGRKLEIEDRQQLAIRRAHFALLNQADEILVLRSDHIEEQEGNPLAWLTLRPILSHFESPRLNVDELAFLMRSDRPALLGDMLVVERNYTAAKGQLSYRNELRTRLDDRIAFLRNGGHLPPEIDANDEESRRRLEAAIGQPLLGQLKAATDELLRCLSVGRLDSMFRTVRDLEAFATAAFPEYRPPGHVILDNELRAEEG